jgi:beta-glucanase (GH16 family)
VGLKWVLAWSDEFDGTEIDGSKWSISGDIPRRKGYWVKEDAYLDGRGHLVLRTKSDGQRFTSGAINSAGKFEQRFGFWAIRCKFPEQEGHWPSFWLYTESVMNEAEQGRDGTEIDVVEKPLRIDMIQHALHWNGYEKAHRSVRKESAIAGVSQGFQVFAVEWGPSEYVFYVNGQETWRTNAGGVSQVLQYIVISEEIDSWAGDIRKARLPDYFVVDWVRVYKAESLKLRIN